MVKRTKNLISFLISAFVVMSLSVSAFADPLTGGLIGVIDAIGVVVGGSGLTPAIINQEIGDPTRTDVPIGLDDTYVRVHHNSTVIDGVPYDSIIFSPEYAAFLREEGLGWIADNSIDPNSSGIIAQGVGFVENIPVFSSHGSIQTQYYSCAPDGSFSFGNVGVSLTSEQQSSRLHVDGTISLSDGTSNTSGANIPNSLTPNLVFVVQSIDFNSPYARFLVSNLTSSGGLSPQVVAITSSNPALFDNSPFEFDYVSATIDTSEHNGESLKVLIPSGHLEDVDDGDYPVTGGVPPSVDLEAINQAIIDAIVELEELIGEFIETPVPPTPTPTPIPIPTDALGLVPYPTWMDTFGNAVKQGIQNINDTIGLFKHDVVEFFDTVGLGIQNAIEDVCDLVGLFKQEVLDTLDTWGQAIEDGLENLGDIFNTGITTLRGILEAIRTALGTIVNTLSDILEHIQQGHLDLFQPVFDGIKIVFAPVLLLLKSALSLWHYVVEWVQATAPVFSTFFGFMSGTNYNMVLPIYAALAGPICIAIYKRFGR